VNVVADEVSQSPAPIVIVADANDIVAAPLALRLPAPKPTLAFVSVRTPVQVKAPLNVVLIPGLTVRLFAVCGMLTEPPEAFTTTVEDPAANVPRRVSIEATVIVDPLAVSAPPPATFNVVALTGRLEPLVSRVVVPAPPPTVRVPPTRSPRVAIVNVTVAAPELKVTPANSFPGRFDPAKVIVCAVAALNMTVALPAFQDPEVLAFVHEPDTVQAPEPNAM
jgi:hypothetical protein